MDPELEARVRTVLAEWDIASTENQGLHSWRCRYPDRYGPCTCFEEFVAELMAAIRKEHTPT